MLGPRRGAPTRLHSVRLAVPARRRRSARWRTPRSLQRSPTSSASTRRCALAHAARPHRRARRRARRRRRRGRQGRARRHPARPDRGRRGPRGARRRLDGDAAQAQPGRRDLRARLRQAGARRSSPRCWPRWCRSTSAPPAPGTPSGARSPSLLTTTGSAAAWLRTSLEGLEVDADRMRATSATPPTPAPPPPSSTERWRHR